MPQISKNMLNQIANVVGLLQSESSVNNIHMTRVSG